MKIACRRFFFFVLWLCHLGVGLACADTYTLTVAEKSVNLIGTKQTAIVANDSLPAPTLHWREGEEVTLHVINRLQEQTSIHWHGIVLPYQMDGVPGVSFSGIEPGQTFTYRFRLKQNGTYWYHGHSGMQEQQGLFGALVIDPVHPRQKVERDYVLLLSDWPEADPYRTHARLKKQSDYYNFQKRTVVDFFNDISKRGFAETLSDRLDWGQMRMEPTDFADVTGATYHFLVNGQTPEMNWTGLFGPGDRVRLRIINASAMTHFDVRIPGLTMRVIEVDGQPVIPVDVEEFRIAVAETYDVLVEPKADRAYRLFAEAMDRSGFAAATLTPKIGLLAQMPTLRPLTLLTMADMGPMHGGGHAGHADHQAMPMSGMAEQPPDAEHAEHAAPPNHSMHEGHDASMPATQTEAEAPMRHTEAPAMGSYKVLSYQHLMAAAPNREWRQADREITLRLTGNMYRYIWSFDDIKYSESEPIRVKFGEHIRFTYVNETMMNHPIHLHGLWQYLDNGNGAYNPKKHVINVPPGKTVSVIVVADAEGEWAFHCHLLYHMDAGMFRKLIVEKREHAGR
ncbi:copper resistance system multicopper oxidase [Methylomicrobium lacus]|uniref:copper resistance system multicopper oxidase n=1 Tax=Methylomicrobium lacus TaxID=136992 RepID=UPI00045EAF7C|nr:copper resistance system multicopper oxidase [Methylomicrobium lacus]